MSGSSVRVEATGPDDPRAVAAVTAYLAEIDDAFGAGARLEPSELEPFRPPTGAFLLAVDAEGEVLGCGGLRDLGDGVAEVKRMWVHPRGRGRGVGRGLLRALEATARTLGHEVVRLDTNDALVAALGLYRSSGYAEIERYNENPHARHWFEKRLGAAATDDDGAIPRSEPA